MPIGIEKTKLTVSSVSSLVSDIVSMVQSGLTASSIPKIFDVINDIKNIIESAPGAFPELKDLNAEEASELGGAAYNAISKIVAQIKSPAK